MFKQRHAFTLVELLIVIAVIGILTTIGILGVTQYQADSRDAVRSAKATAIVEALEKYYDKNGEYPSCDQITQSPEIVSQSVLVGIDVDALRTPKGNNNSITCNDLTSVADGDYFSYTGDTSDTCAGAGGNACAVYTLKYIREGSKDIATVDSRRQTPLSADAIPTLTMSASGFTTASATWTGIAGSTGYTLQYSKTLTFPAVTDPNTLNSGTVTASTASQAVSGLQYDTLYYFRVRAESAGGSGNWSTNKTATTWSLATPSCSAVANSFTQITASWGAVPNATSYTLEYDDTSNFSSLVGTYSGTALSRAVTGLSYATTYYFRVRAVVASGNSDWSPSCQVATQSLATPAAPTNCGVTFSSFCADIPDISNATGYVFQCSGDNVTWNSGCETSTITASTFTFTGAAYGYTYYMRARAVNGSYTSSWSPSTATSTMSLATPSSCTATADSFTQITASWGAVPNATSYTVQGSTSSSFTSVAEYTTTGTSQAFPSLAYGTTHYFRVRANVSNGNSPWSPTCQVATLSLSTPSISTTVNSTTQITASWGAISNATSYTVQSSTSSSFTSPTSASTTSLSRAFSGLLPGTTYYFRVQAVNGSYTSSWSSTSTNTTPNPVAAPGDNCIANYSSRSQYGLNLQVQETNLDVAANTSDVYWRAFRRPNSNGPTGSFDMTNYPNITKAGYFTYSINVNGTVASGNSSSGRWRERAYATPDYEQMRGANTTTDSWSDGTQRIAHDADGTRTISVSISDGNGGSQFGSASCSFSYTLADLR